MDSNTVVFRLLCVVKNPHNHPEAIESALTALRDHHSQDEAVIEFFEKKRREDRFRKGINFLKTKPIK